MKDSMIEIEGLSKSFASVRAVNDVGFRARKGEILGILGPNGAGKTTTLRILCGYIMPDAGRARVGNKDVVSESLAVRRMIGYLPENVPLYPEMRVREYLRFRGGIKGVPRRRQGARSEAVAGQCGISSVLDQTIGTLSKGYRQRVGLADALIAEPPVLVLDEPTVGLDPNQVLELRELIRELEGNHTILLSSHILSEVEQVCDRVVIFRQGKVIAEDSTETLRQGSSATARITIELPLSSREQLPALTESLAHVESTEELDDGWLRALLSAPGDPREEIFRRAAGKQLTLRELTRRQLSLEEVFHDLTTRSDQSEEPS